MHEVVKKRFKDDFGVFPTTRTDILTRDYSSIIENIKKAVKLEKNRYNLNSDLLRCLYKQ